MFLKPEGRIDLAHRAYFLRGAPARSVLVAAAKDGELSVVSAETNVLHRHRLPSKIRAVSPHPTDRRLAWVDDDSGLLNVQDPGAERPVEIAPPQAHEGAPEWIRPGFEDCRFDDSGEFLWLVAPRNAGECEVQLVETEGWSVAHKAAIEDPFGGSSCSFHRTTRPGLVSLWLAAGQDGQQVYWLNRSGSGFSCRLEGRLRNTIPPVFSHSGDHILVVNEAGLPAALSYRRLSYSTRSGRRAGDGLPHA